MWVLALLWSAAIACSIAVAFGRRFPLPGMQEAELGCEHCAELGDGFGDEDEDSAFLPRTPRQHIPEHLVSTIVHLALSDVVGRDLGRLDPCASQLVASVRLASRATKQKTDAMLMGRMPVRHLVEAGIVRLMEACSGSAQLHAHMRCSVESGCSRTEDSRFVWQCLTMIKNEVPSDQHPPPRVSLVVVGPADSCIAFLNATRAGERVAALASSRLESFAGFSLDVYETTTFTMLMRATTRIPHPPT
jgi:hypothetical protein